jgi:hypothetical protein
MDGPRCRSRIELAAGIGQLAMLAACAGLASAQPVGLGAGLDDVSVEGDAVDDGGDEAGVGEHGSPFAERQNRSASARSRPRSTRMSAGLRLSSRIRLGTAPNCSKGSVHLVAQSTGICVRRSIAATFSKAGSNSEASCSAQGGAVAIPRWWAAARAGNASDWAGQQAGPTRNSCLVTGGDGNDGRQPRRPSQSRPV